MKHNSFPSKEELLYQCNTIKRRQERIIQVRQQSKQMSAAILERVKQEAQKQCNEIENQVLSEIRDYHQKELEYSRKQYEKCISEINQRHYLQQINMNKTNFQIPNNKKLRNSSATRSAASNNNDRRVNKQPEEKSTAKPIEQRTSFVQNPCRKSNGKKVRVTSPPKFSQDIVIDSDDDGVKKYKMLNFRKHSPEVKHLKSLQSGNEDESRSRGQRKSHCLNTHKSKLIHSKAVENHMLTNDKSNKTQIDKMYDHLVHDRIRILEQKDKILDRQTMFLPNGVSMTEKPPRFSEYFTRFHSTKKSSTNFADIQSNTSRNETGINKIKNDMKRIELKKKLLKNELTNTNDAIHSKPVSLSDEKQNEKKQDSPSSSEKSTINSSSNKNSPAPNSSDSSSKRITPRNKLCPSPIPKATNNVNDSSRESDKKEKSSSKRHHCKRKLRSRDIQITVSNNRKAVSDTVTNTQQNGTSNSSQTNKDFQQNITPPVKLVVNVLPSADCKIEIKNNTSDKRHVRCTSKQNAGKVKDWRTLFKNQDKLTESSYYSLPEYSRKIHATSSEDNDEQEIIPCVKVATKDISYYVRKLLLMSPESIDNLDVSSCNTTLIEDSSRTTSIDSNPIGEISPRLHNDPQRPEQVSSSRIASKENRLNNAENNYDNSENVRQLLLKCLRLATTEADDINLTTFKSVDSSCDSKTLGNMPASSELNDSNTLYRDFINTAIQRLLPLYQNSLDDNLDYTTQSQQILNRTEDQSEINVSKNDSACISTPVCLQKFVSSLSATPEKPYTNHDIIEYLKQYIESQSYPENDNEIPEDSSGSADNEPSKDESYISLPSVDELIRKGLISKTYALNEVQNEPKEFLNEEEFIKKMLQVDFTSKESNLKGDSGQIKTDDSGTNHQSDPDEKYATDIRKELRRLGLNWMDTTLQRTLQASVINSTSSAEDSAGPLRSNAQFSSYHQPSISSNFIAPHQQPEHQSREFLNISPITIPDLQLSVPQCFRKN